MENLEENKKLLKIPIRKKINYMDGLRLNRAIISGVKSLISRQEYLNKINVFPVPDGDTGTNMAFTLSAVMEGSIGQIEPRVDVYTKIISDAAIMMVIIWMKKLILITDIARNAESKVLIWIKRN